MRSPRAALSVAFLIAFAIPCVSSADAISLRPDRFDGGGRFRQDFFFGYIEPLAWDTFVDGRGVNATGMATITAGPAISIDITRNALGMPTKTTYVYGSAEFAMSLHWDPEGDGSMVEGHFTAPIPDLHFTVLSEDCLPCSESKPGTEEAIFLGAGEFDAALANLLGVQRRTTGGEMFFYLEAITGSPDLPDTRHGDFNHPNFAIDALTVPEPATMGLLSLAAATFAWRRRPRRGHASALTRYRDL